MSILLLIVVVAVLASAIAVVRMVLIHSFTCDPSFCWMKCSSSGMVHSSLLLLAIRFLIVCGLRRISIDAGGFGLVGVGVELAELKSSVMLNDVVVLVLFDSSELSLSWVLSFSCS